MNGLINTWDLFPADDKAFEKTALSLFLFQYNRIPIYKKYVDQLGIDINGIQTLTQIPFLPISFFKTNQVKAVDADIEIIFESSGTTLQVPSKHYVQDLGIYQKCLLNSFESHFGKITECVILGLLPGYLERPNASLVYMVNSLMKASEQTSSGFFLHDFKALTETLYSMSNSAKKVILFGVTHALLDYFESTDVIPNNVSIVETGGMKGKRKEISKSEVYETLSKKISMKKIYGEYGMTELLSPSYSDKENLYEPPLSLKAMVREMDDPFVVKNAGRGALNIIDLGNLYSCSFIATEDTGEVFENGNFSLYGRLEESDLRGCNLMYH